MLDSNWMFSLVLPLIFQGCTQTGNDTVRPRSPQVNSVQSQGNPDVFEVHSRKLKQKIEGDTIAAPDSSQAGPEAHQNGEKSRFGPLMGKFRDREFTQDELAKACGDKLASFPGKYDKKLLADVCQKVEIKKGCVSRNGQPIYHFDRISKRKNSEKILTFAVTHGDEIASGAVARSWAARLSRISPRNSWRIVPVLNPDGYDKRTRTNGAGVDINRNYPSKDWDKLALKWWKEKKKSDKRRYPGPKAASEPETVCSMDHIDEFQPDLIISIHTPLGLLDFDGPRMNFPRFSKLPWMSLGTYPGSLGRYMWYDDKKVPVMTIELKGGDVEQALTQIDQLQDISGQVALTISKSDPKSEKIKKTKKN